MLYVKFKKCSSHHVTKASCRVANLENGRVDFRGLAIQVVTTYMLRVPFEQNDVTRKSSKAFLRQFLSLFVP